MLNKSIDKCEENIRKLKENSTLIQKQLQLDELEKMLRGLDYTISSDTEKIGGMRARIRIGCQKTDTSGKTRLPERVR